MSELQRVQAVKSGIVPDDYTGSVASDWPSLIDIIERRVKSSRSAHSTAHWWHFERRRGQLYEAAATQKRVLVRSLTSAHASAFTWLPPHLIYDQTLVVWPDDNANLFAILTTRIHEVWVRFLGADIGGTGRYNVTDCFETFPLPIALADVSHIAEQYYEYRATLMGSNNEGMTKTYNRFHKSDERNEPIQRLRDLHDEMDRAVLRSYGWYDLADELRPEFLTEETEDDHSYQGRYFWNAEGRDRALSRLLALNAERHAEEVRMGIAPKCSARIDEDEDDSEGGVL
jgi:hypothetical protein